MATDIKKSVPRLEPGTPVRAKALHNGQEDYTIQTLREQRAHWWLQRDFLFIPIQPNSKKIVPRFGAYQDKVSNPAQESYRNEAVRRVYMTLRTLSLNPCSTQGVFNGSD